jgi:SWI/SNF-related matrix-associated actin-dependent regulator 1 of chromatin subfamily A
VLNSRNGVSPTAHYVLCSYDLSRNEGIHAALCSRKWDLIILDEVHYLKSTDAIRTRAVFGGGAVNSRFFKYHLADYATRIIALSGTPLPNRPRECYTVARGLNWESIDWLSYDRFQFRYNQSATLYSGATLEEKGRLPELQARLRCNFMVRRMKKDVLPQLPDKRYEMSYIEATGQINEVLARERLIDFDPKSMFNPNFKLDGTPIATLRREMGEAKVPRVIEHLRYLLDVVEIEKLVVFTYHNSVMDSIIEAMQKYGVVCVRGGMQSAAKDHSVQDFAYGKPRVFLGQIDTMEGIDGLQHVCSHVVFAEPAWNPGRNEQCVDRCHRIGQHGNVVAQFLIVEDSMDEKVLHAVLGKSQSIYESLDKRIA